MPDVFVVGNDSHSVPMNRVRCRDEEKELQLLLEKNPQLMPGDQINPNDPRRWLLIKREMPVPDPSSGEDRWSIDHFFVDQSATPTFVECKRYLDTRSRREVVGQMLDYAANGHWYWEREMIRDFATQTAREGGMELEDALARLSPDSAAGVDEFLEKIENNLREGQVRLIFFMEEAPLELKSIVDFLNKQMERSEILIVEAKLFESSGLRVVAPYLFGFTEESRRVKKTVTVTSREKRKWDERLFFEDAQAVLSPNEVEAVRALYQFGIEQGLKIKWGGGKTSGSFSLVAENVVPRSFLSMYSNGMFSINFGYVVGSPVADEFREGLARVVREDLEVPLQADLTNKYPCYKAQQWSPKVALLIERVRTLLAGVNGR